jgi:molybdopterin-containing oxidoreductase family iron-sulfur binding subunit
MGLTRKYWKGIEELKETPEFIKHKEQEFPSQQTIEQFLADDNLAETSTARRDFLKFLGFSVAAATLAACEAPVTKAVPYVVKPENVTPGMPTWYASTYYDGNSYASILVKTREGRPIFIKGNHEFGFTKGGTNPQIVASVLGLYDSERLTGPKANKKDVSWSSVDKEIAATIKSAKKVTLLSNTVISPSLNRAIAEMTTALNGEGGSKFEHVQYDAVSYSAIRQANLKNFGAPIIPGYDFSKAKTIVSLDADFLSSWLLPTEFAVQYGQTRIPGDNMSKHFQFESVMSVTGSNADYRGMAKPSELAGILAYLIKGLGGNPGVNASVPAGSKLAADEAVKALKKSGKNSLVVCGLNNVGLQILTN